MSLISLEPLKQKLQWQDITDPGLILVFYLDCAPKIQHATTRPHRMNTYLQFVRAAEAKDEATITRLIREHPELHNFEGDDGGLLNVLRHNCPELFGTAFAAGLSPDAGSSAPHQTLLQQAVCDSDVELVRLCLRYGVDVERRNCEGETSLGYAASWASLDVV